MVDLLYHNAEKYMVIEKFSKSWLECLSTCWQIHVYAADAFHWRRNSELWMTAFRSSNEMDTAAAAAAVVAVCVVLAITRRYELTTY